MDSWMIWIAAGIICMIIEIFTPGFLFMSFGIGAILTGIVSIFLNNLVVQIFIFGVFTLVVFIFLRKFSKKLISKSYQETNIFALKGKKGIVTKEILEDHRGYVKIGGEEWSAVSVDDRRIARGEKIVVVSFEGNKLLVDRFDTEEE